MCGRMKLEVPKSPTNCSCLRSFDSSGPCDSFRYRFHVFLLFHLFRELQMFWRCGRSWPFVPFWQVWSVWQLLSFEKLFSQFGSLFISFDNFANFWYFDVLIVFVTFEHFDNFRRFIGDGRSRSFWEFWLFQPFLQFSTTLKIAGVLWRFDCFDSFGPFHSFVQF